MSAAEVHIDCRCCIEHRLYDVVGAVDVRMADDLYVCLGSAAVLADEGCHILEYVGCEACLDDEHVVVAFDRLHDAQIVYVTVIVKVEIRQHV